MWIYHWIVSVQYQTMAAAREVAILLCIFGLLFFCAYQGHLSYVSEYLELEARKEFIKQRLQRVFAQPDNCEYSIV